MKTVDISKALNTGFRAYKDARKVATNIKILYLGARFGSKGIAHINPAAVCVDAVFSLLDALESYLNYRKAKEITAQLEIELKTMKEELKYLKKTLEESLKTKKLEYEEYLAQVEEKIKEQKEEREVLYSIYKKTGEHLEMIKNLLIEHKRNYLSDEKLRDLENKYLETLQKRLELAYIL